MNYLEFSDLVPGQSFRSAEYEMTAEEIITFAKEFDPQSFHTDAEAAKDSLFGQLVASGWHTASVTMKLMVSCFGSRLKNGVIGGELETLRWHKPVRPGDRLHVVTTLLDCRESRSRPDLGQLRIETLTYNQTGAVVQSYQANVMVPRRQ